MSNVMQHRPLRLIAMAYGGVVLFAAVWAVFVDIRMLHSEREHLLPDVVLALITMPLSETTLSPLYRSWPGVFGNELVQVGWSAACGLFQAAVLFLVDLILTRTWHGA
jgi:hypothetical protein